MASSNSRVLRNATAQLFFSEQPKQALDQVKPGGTGGSEVQNEAQMAQQPALDYGSLIGAVVVENQMQLESGCHGRINGLQEVAKLGCTMAPMKLADHSPGFDIKRCEQVDGAVALVIAAMITEASVMSEA
jgi:hypothetical protein